MSKNDTIHILCWAAIFEKGYPMLCSPASWMDPYVEAWTTAAAVPLNKHISVIKPQFALLLLPLRLLQELNETSPDALVPVNLELVKDLWLPNIFIYNLKTFKVVEVLSKHAGLWVSPENAILYSQATHITFICPMRFDSFPLDTQVSLLVKQLGSEQGILITN